MKSFGEAIRTLRDERKLPLRVVSAYLDIDQAILSKIERGHRIANRKQVLKLAEFFKVDKDELLVLWLADKLVNELADEELGIQALQLAEESISYKTITKDFMTSMISKIKNVLDLDGRVNSAWLFGSMANLEANSNSDVDLIVEFNGDKKYSIFDLADIAHSIETRIHRKVDLSEKGQLKDFAMQTAQHNLQKIYG